MRKTISIFIALCLIFSLLPFGTLALNNAADITISSRMQLLKFVSDAVDNGETFEGKTVMLAADIDASSISWRPVTEFKGAFDGDGHSITINSTTNGVFTTNNGTIRNLVVKGKISTPDKAHSSGTYISRIAGIAATNNGEIINCINYAEVTTNYQQSYCAGITGLNTGILRECANFGNISYTYYASHGTTTIPYVGGIAGMSSGEESSIVSCANKGTVLAKDEKAHVGGIVGLSSTDIINCYNNSKIVGLYRSGSVNNIYVGGIVGKIEKGYTVSNCYNTGNVLHNTSDLKEPGAGAIAGYSFEPLLNCYYLKDSALYSYNSITNTVGMLTDEDMKDSEFPALLGDAYRYVEGHYPALAWETNVHDMPLQEVEGQEASCEEGGSLHHYVCPTCGHMFEDESCSKEISDVSIAPLGHSIEVNNAVEATCVTAGFSGDQVCRVCGKTVKAGETIPAKGHSWGDWIETTPATEDKEGVETRTCVTCGEKQTRSIPMLNHSHTLVAVAKVEATCDKDGTEAHWKCPKCGKVFSDAAGQIELQAPIVIPAIGHKYVSSVTTPTCTEPGCTTHTCTRCGSSYVDNVVEALGHKAVIEGVVDATCTTSGYTGDWVCSVCGEKVKQGEAVPAHGHKWDSGKVTKEPTETAEGIKTFTCTVCGETRTEAIPKLTPVTPPTPKNPFVDVKQGQYYYDPVLWAVNHQPQITNGTSVNTFSPDATCTRGQVVTFLWRAKGCPEPKNTNNPFTDVKEGTYYYKAVLWANENNITNGTGATTFSPESPCTRAHVVTFLWRTANKPEAGSGNPFKDVPSGQYYTDAVLWAVNHNPQITNGTGKDTFSPESPCTRGQIVTFLYRYMK